MNNVINIHDIASGLEIIDDIWICKSSSSFSYPDSGNELCFSIEENSFWFKHRSKCIIEVIKKFPPKNNTLFDIGGGNGYVSESLTKEGINTYLVEPGETGIKNAKNRGLKNLICSTIEDAGFKKESLPSVGLFDVLEHIDKDTKFLHSIRDYLIKGGRLYATVPAYNLLWSKDDVYAGHYRRYRRKELENKLKEIGFTINYSTYFFSFLPLPIFMFRKIPGILRKEKNIDLKKYARSHQVRSHGSNVLVQQMCNIEMRRIKKQKLIPWGSSCLLAATLK